MIVSEKKGFVVSIYDPAVSAYRDVSLENYRLQLKSLGLVGDEIKEKVKKSLKLQVRNLEDLGVSKTEIIRILKEYE